MWNSGLNEGYTARGQYISHSAEETIALGLALGKRLPRNSVVCFHGDLGAGKTTFIKGVVAGVTGDSRELVNSPTFVYLNIYEGKAIGLISADSPAAIKPIVGKNVYHFDLYRLRDAEDFLSMGFEEMFSLGGVCCIEWSERIAPLLPLDRIDVVMTHEGENRRKIAINNEPFFE